MKDCPRCKGKGWLYDPENGRSVECADCAFRERVDQDEEAGPLFEKPDLPPSLDERFREFHRVHPEVYRELVRLCREAKRRGRLHIGVGCLWEVMRWSFWMRWEEDDEFKLNNNHRAYYARLIMRREPDLVGVFETRRLVVER